jgi:hypothetical protein
VTTEARAQVRGIGGLSSRAATWLAWSLCVLSLTLTALSLLLLALNVSQPGTHVYNYWLENTVLPVSFSILGAIIAPRLPANPLGWLFCAAGFVSAAEHFSAEYAIYALLTQPHSLPAGEALAWLASWVWILFIGFIVLLLLLFPTGRLQSKRWRSLAWLTAAVVLVAMISAAFSSGAVDGLGPIQNPLGVEGFSTVYNAVWSFMFPLLFVAAALSLFMRLRRAIGVERQQLKWFAYAAAAVAIGPFFAYIIPEAIGAPLWFEWAGIALLCAGLAGIPISMGIAILRYRLYEIDLIINRTLVYGSLTALLAAVYFSGVAATQAIFRALTGQEQQPQLVVVVSTLVIAALFNPLRRRIQGFIDRLFYRRKYDAAKTLAAFSARMSEESDLEKLGEDLVGVVTETMRPSHVSLLLRPDPEPKEEKKKRAAIREAGHDN